MAIREDGHIGMGGGVYGARRMFENALITTHSTTTTSTTRIGLFKRMKRWVSTATKRGNGKYPLTHHDTNTKVQLCFHYRLWNVGTLTPTNP
jgi:hypothetical protein